MKTFNFKIIMLIAILALASLSLKAQVVIGSPQLEPEKAMLLDLKNQTANPSTNETVNDEGGGLGLPRVRLVNRTTLEPFISDSPADLTADVKKLHTGMVVYNLSTGISGFQQGLYVWDGNEWAKMQDDNNSKTASQKFFYMPSFNIELTGNVGDKDSFNLYEEYKRQFTRNSSNPQFKSNPGFTGNVVPTRADGQLYEANELDYVVTYYDTQVIQVDSISNAGLLSYTIKGLTLTLNSFINVVLVVK
jgi:hypothetical protein